MTGNASLIRGSERTGQRAMVAFEVFRNNERLCVAGVGDFGVLTACVPGVAHLPEKVERWQTEGISNDDPTALKVEVGGLRDGLHLRWTDGTLQVGDEIRIHVMDASRVDGATTEYRDDPGQDLERKKTYVRRLARELGWEIREA